MASPEVKFEIDTETHDPLDVGMYQVREANQMVEEMMLLANITVAEHILRHFPAQALLRRHPVPPPRQFDPLLKAAVAAGVSINPETSQVSCSCQGCKGLVQTLCRFLFGMLVVPPSTTCAVASKGLLYTKHGIQGSAYAWQLGKHHVLNPNKTQDSWCITAALVQATSPPPLPLLANPPAALQCGKRMNASGL